MTLSSIWFDGRRSTRARERRTASMSKEAELARPREGRSQLITVHLGSEVNEGSGRARYP